MKKAKKISQNLIFVIISIVIILIVYFAIKISSLFKRPTETTLVKNGEVIKSEEVIGYIIREEEILDTSKYTGIARPTISDSNRVDKNGTIVSYVSKSEESLVKKISDLDVKIQEAMDSRQSIFSNDVKTLDSDIQTKLYNSLKFKNDIYAIHEYKNDINEKIQKKAKIVGDLSPAGSKIKELINERKSYETQINNSKQELKANKAGLVSYRVDNLENILTFKSINSLTIKQLDEFKINTGYMIPINLNSIKIVNNFECYIAIPMSSLESKNAQLSDKLYLGFDNMGNDLVPATIEYISEEEDSRLVVFKIRINVEELVKYRKINLDVIWSRNKGLKVPKNSVKESGIVDKDENKIATVNVQKMGNIEEVWVKIIAEAGDFCIIENCIEEELVNLGIKEPGEHKTVKMYDEILVN